MFTFLHRALTFKNRLIWFRSEVWAASEKLRQPRGSFTVMLQTIRFGQLSYRITLLNVNEHYQQACRHFNGMSDL